MVALVAPMAVAESGISDAVEAYVADFNPTMKVLLRGCTMLSGGVKAGDADMVGEAADILYSNFNADDKLVGDLRVTAIDTDSVIPITNCFDFSDKYCLKWLDANYGIPILERAPLMREIGNQSACKMLRLRLKPHSKAVYSMRMKGKCHMFSTYEPATDVTMSIMTADGKDVSGQHFEDEMLWAAIWDAPAAKTEYIVTFTNESDIPSTIYLFSN